MLTCVVLLALGACQILPKAGAPSHPLRRASAIIVPAALLEGTFDNHEQVWSARERPVAAPAVPHVVVTVEPTSREDWSIWRIHFDASPSLDAVWAMRRIGVDTLVPHRAAAAAPVASAAFDPQQWLPLDACAMRGSIAASSLRIASDLAACTALVPGIGAQAALLPLGIEREGEWLHLQLYADQARGAQARSDLRQVHVFTGWAAVNGAGPAATAEGNDWHMNRGLRLGSEGGRAPLAWRDGKPSGYSLTLERLTYREGNIPVLKLSVVDDAGGRALAYAWANPEATRIGINLGWVQVGLERAGDAMQADPGGGP